MYKLNPGYQATKNILVKYGYTKQIRQIEIQYLFDKEQKEKHIKKIADEVFYDKSQLMDTFAQLLEDEVVFILRKLRKSVRMVLRENKF